MPGSNLPILYSPDAETIPVDESKDIECVVESVRTLLARDRAGNGEIRADVHVKTHGFAHGEFAVLPGLPEELAQGLFCSPKSFAAIVRFSNSANRPMPDIVPDGRGLSIKVLDVDGELFPTESGQSNAQDFVFINHPVFFAANAKDFLRLEKVLEETEKNPLAATRALTGEDWNPFHWHWNEMLKVAGIVGKVPTHPASYTYYSMSPFRFGKYIAKFRVEPVNQNHESWLKTLLRFGTSSDAMRLALEETLVAESIQFDFQVQLRTSAEIMPVEDPTVRWPESESPFRTVARLALPIQDITGYSGRSEFRNLAFNVWHSMLAHQPLGGINRVRREVYPVSAAWRRQKAE